MLPFSFKARVESIGRLFLLLFLIGSEYSYSQTGLLTWDDKQLKKSRLTEVTFPAVTLPGIVENKNYWLAAAEVAGINFGVWVYNKYLTNEGWSGIRANTIKQKFENRFLMG